MLHVADKLADKRSIEILKNMHKFIYIDFKSIQNKPKEEISKIFQNFISKQADLFIEIWTKEISNSSNKYSIFPEVIDLLEKNLCVSLYNKLFSANHIEIEEDYRFEMHVETLGFISMNMLDIKSEYFDEDYFKLAISSLKKINQYKAPKDKLFEIINYCKIISQMVLNLSNKPTGADDIFPFFIYGIIKGNIRKLKSNINFIKHFRHHSRLESEEDCNFTHVFSSVSFIETIKPYQINLSEKEYENLVNIEKEKIKSAKLGSLKEIKTLKNSDESYLLYYLNNNKNEENTNYVELTEFTYSNESKIPKSLPDSLISSEDVNSILKIDLDKLYNEYFTEDISKLSFFKMEKMYNDFKLILIMIDNIKANSNLKQSISNLSIESNETKQIIDKKSELKFN